MTQTMHPSIEAQQKTRTARWLFLGSAVLLCALLIGTVHALGSTDTSGDRTLSFLFFGYFVLAAITMLAFRQLFQALDRVRKAEGGMRAKGPKSEQEIRTGLPTENSLERAMGRNPSAIMTFRSMRDTDGAITDFETLMANEEAERITGLSHNDLVGGHLSDVMPDRTTDGTLQEFIKVVDSGVPYIAERRNGQNGIHHWQNTHAIRLNDGFAVAFTDITERSRARELAEEAARLSLADGIARTIAHEVRNPLTNVHLGMEQLTMDLVNDREAVQPLLDIVQRNVKRIGQLVTEMLESSRRRELKCKRCTVQDLVNDAMKSLADRLDQRDMRGEVDLPQNELVVLVDPELIKLAITNLAVNAIEAMEPGNGILKLTGKATFDGVVITVRDNGKGIAPANIPRLFEAFYSERAGAMGLGLTTARGILNAHGILLQVESSLGQGTTFTLLFPK